LDPHIRFEVGCSALDTNDCIPMGQKIFRKITSILASDSGDDGNPVHFLGSLFKL